MKTLNASDDSGPEYIGKCKILRQLGSSETVIVYEAAHRTAGRRVVLKVLKLPRGLSETQSRGLIERFNLEAKAAGTLAHPNIVTIYEVGVDRDRHFVAMEFLEGHSLKAIQQMQGALPLKESLEVALQAGDALDHAHGRGVVHQNISPENIHILPGGIIKITNFEHAKIEAESNITAQGAQFASPAYMSPEQLASQPVDHRTDIFSLGVTLYEMLAGRGPFVGDSVLSTADNIMNRQPPTLLGIPDDVNAILQRALAKEPKARYQTMVELCSDLRKAKAAVADRG
jgi:serine/threonine protein kinase